MPLVVPKEEKNSPFPTKSVLSRRYSLKSTLLWGKLLSTGARIRKGPYTIIFIPHQEFNIGFIVPKRFFAKAHTRNRVKRLLREASASLMSHYRELPKAAIIVKYGNKQKSPPSLNSAIDLLKPLFLEVKNSNSAIVQPQEEQGKR
ncbi:MAG TPA: hypothetical protein DCF84_07440 [Bacteroidetes bacterium]|nr:hypothetical protein [Bacteroidota bacterium]